MDLQALTCPLCRSTHIIQVADGTFRCQGCQARLLLVDELGKLVVPDVEGWLDCSGCGAVNQAQYFYCTRCGAALRYRCPLCGTVRMAQETICGVCGKTYQDAQHAAQYGVRRKRWRNRSLFVAGVAVGIMLIAWMTVITSFDWENNSTVYAISNVLCCGSPLVGLVAGLGAYWLQRRGGGDPPDRL